MAEIPLTRDALTIIDDEDIDWITTYRWHFDPGNTRHGYAKACINGKTVYLHRLLIGAGVGQFVDHINRNSLDNRKCNLRIATRSQNGCNSVKPFNKYGYRGIEAVKLNNTFRAAIKIESGRVIRGTCRDTAIEAARDYDELARQHHGPFAVLNFPREEVAA